MPFRLLTATAASLALLSASAAFAAQPASSSASRLSINNAPRAGAPASEQSNRLGGGTGGIAAAAIGLGIAALVVFAVLDETDDDDEDPVSP